MKKNNRKRVSLPRRIIGDILIGLAILLTADVVIIMIRRINRVVLKASYQEIFGYEIILLVILLLFAFDVRFGFFTKMKNKAAKVIGWFFRIVVIFSAACILFFCGRVIVGSLNNTAAPASHVIVLGMALENGKPTNDLISRIKTAEEYLDNNSDAVLILTGGNPDESGKTEAEVMRDLLTADGVQENKLILEDKAETTKENFANVVKLIDPNEPVVLISSNYHMTRSVKIAKRAGFTNILRLPAPSEFRSFGANMMWEVVMELKDVGKVKEE